MLLSGAAEFVEEGAGANNTVLLVRPATAVTVIVITVGLASELRGRRVAGEPRQSNGRSSVRACCSAERRSLSRRELMRKHCLVVDATRDSSDRDDHRRSPGQ